ncbi:hypothetical protein HMPREF0650_1532 [Hoylesella buccalis ATCC 35310]|uniref:Uncharacterized protein n=1 Tax=Hoylesella buccalis ATCC 35310 TaxID=679190 RepID=D1W5U5_9BACT|nr:hypothetical protein HMPREF0650_1532 [Hoylesella buccalis ATCC 35310]
MPLLCLVSSAKIRIFAGMVGWLFVFYKYYHTQLQYKCKKRVIFVSFYKQTEI